MNSLLDFARYFVRKIMKSIAKVLNRATAGHLSPNLVTIAGLLAHVPIVWLIAKGDQPVLAAALLVVFGLFDTLDGELARLQERTSSFGMFLDSVADRLKEVMIYLGLLIYLYGDICGYTTASMCGSDLTSMNILILITLSLSLLTSYTNAWGEAVLSRSGVSNKAVNKTFRGGYGSFEIRITLLIIGLLVGDGIFYVLVLIAILTSHTILSRINNVRKELKRVQS